MVQTNIVYTQLKLLSQQFDGSQFNFLADDGGTLGVVEYIQARAQALKPHQCILWFALSQAEAENLATHLKCCLYHAKLDNLTKVHMPKARQDGGTHKSILMSTNTPGLGLDCWISLVFYYGAAQNLIDQDQESGRAGRDGQPAHSIIF